MTRTGKSFVWLIALIIILGVVFLIFKPATAPPESEPAEDTEISGYKTYTDPGGAFSFDYHRAFSAESGNLTAPTRDWGLGNDTSGIVLAVLSAPSSYLPGTNFSGAKLTVGRSSEKEAIRNCSANPGNSQSLGEVLIGGYPFKKWGFTDAATGSLYETSSYRGLFDGDCHVIEYIIQSG